MKRICAVSWTITKNHWLIRFKITKNPNLIATYTTGMPQLKITEDQARIVLRGYYRGITLSNSNSASLHQNFVQAHSSDFLIWNFLFFLRLLSLSSKF